MQKNQTFSLEGFKNYHKCSETTEILGGWFLGQRTIMRV